MTLVLPSALLLLLVAIEAFVLRVVQRKDVPWNQVVFNLNSGHTVLWLFRGLEIAVFHAVYTRFGLGLVNDWHPIVQFGVAMLFWDFCFYWLHRLHHAWGILWAVHVVHHEGEHFSLSLGIRNSWYSSITSIPFFLVLALIGVPTEVFIAVGGIHYFIQFYNHNALVKKSGFLEHVMITPSHHRAHHGRNEPYVNCNFGGTLVLWDKMFGTFQKELNEIPVEFGTYDHIQTDNVFWASNLPILTWLGLPHPEFRPALKTLKGFWIWTAGLLSFAILLYYIHAEAFWPSFDRNVLLAYGAAAAIAIGGMTDGRMWGRITWSVIHLMVLGLCFEREAWQGSSVGYVSAAAFLHAWLTWRKQSWNVVSG